MGMREGYRKEGKIETASNSYGSVCERNKLKSIWRKLSLLLRHSRSQTDNWGKIRVVIKKILKGEKEERLF